MFLLLQVLPRQLKGLFFDSDMIGLCGVEGPYCM